MASPSSLSGGVSPTLDRPRPDASSTSRSSDSSRRVRGVARVLRLLADRTSVLEPEIEGLDQHVLRGDTCLDIGAEYGLYTIGLAALAGSSGRVVAFEPNPSLARWLRIVTRVLRIPRVTVANTALGDAVGWTELSVPRRNFLPVHGRAFIVAGASGEGANTEFSSSRHRRVRMETLDEVCRARGIERVDFVKADVEGAELAVLHGGIEVLKNSQPTLLLEIEQRHLDRYDCRAEDVVDVVLAQGYSMHVWRGARWAPVCEIDIECRNYLFVPPDSGSVGAGVNATSTHTAAGTIANPSTTGT